MCADGRCIERRHPGAGGGGGDRPDRVERHVPAGEFDEELADFVARTTHVIETLLHQVGRILEAAENAQAEQARLEVAREEFRAEVRARAARERLARLDAGAGASVHE